jgi:lipopolysaccharide transport system permease protein
MIIQMAMLGQGIGMIISSLTTKYRDLNYLVSFGTQLMMYASPIVYPLSIVPEKYKLYILANPMTSIIEGFRQAFIGKGFLDMNMFLYSIFFTLVTFILGLLVFNKMEKNFIDTV